MPWVKEAYHDLENVTSGKKDTGNRGVFRKDCEDDLTRHQRYKEKDFFRKNNELENIFERQYVFEDSEPENEIYWRKRKKFSKCDSSPQQMAQAKIIMTFLTNMKEAQRSLKLVEKKTRTIKSLKYLGKIMQENGLEKMFLFSIACKKNKQM